MPLGQHSEGGHGKGEACLERRPDPVHHLFAMEHYRQHGEHRLHEDAILPLPPSTQCEVGRVPLSGMEGSITQDNQASVDLSNHLNVARKSQSILKGTNKQWLTKIG